MAIAAAGTSRVSAQNPADPTLPAEPAPPAATERTDPQAAGEESTPLGMGGPTPGRLEETMADPVEVAADVLVVRPVGVAATAVGAAIFVVALPFAAISGDVPRAARSLVGAPARFTFKRRLGDFDDVL